jgi:RNA polymerase primary sigma factor
MRSVEKFDASRGFKFSTYACRAILKSFSRVAMKLGRYRGLFPVELNTELEKGDFVESRRQTMEQDCLEELRQILASNLADLTDVERTVIRERFALGTADVQRTSKTLEQVGAMIGVTKERVRQIQNKALDKIRHTLEQQILAA